jgi:hypothetical protein
MLLIAHVRFVYGLNADDEQAAVSKAKRPASSKAKGLIQADMRSFVRPVAQVSKGRVWEVHVVVYTLGHDALLRCSQFLPRSGTQTVHAVSFAQGRHATGSGSGPGPGFGSSSGPSTSAHRRPDGYEPGGLAPAARLERALATLYCQVCAVPGPWLKDVLLAMSILLPGRWPLVVQAYRQYFLNNYWKDKGHDRCVLTRVLCPCSPRTQCPCLPCGSCPCTPCGS